MPEVIIGIDAKWQTVSEGNSVLSYQWYGIDGDRCWSGIQYPDLSNPEKQKRLKLAHWVSNALQDEYKGRAWPENVVLAIHFTPAELSTLTILDRSRPASIWFREQALSRSATQ